MTEETKDRVRELVARQKAIWEKKFGRTYEASGETLNTNDPDWKEWEAIKSQLADIWAAEEK